MSTSIQVGSLSVRNNSIGEAIEHAHRDIATVGDQHAGDDSPSDGLVIAPKSPIITRNSMAIRAKLRPLLNEERIEQTNQFMNEFNILQADYAKKQNKRKSFSKRITQSFAVDPAEVQRRFEKGTRAENLPGNRAKAQKMTQKKQGKKKKEESGEVMGWTDIAEEPDHANSDFEAMVHEQANERAGSQRSRPIGNSSLGSEAHDAVPVSAMR